MVIKERRGWFFGGKLVSLSGESRRKGYEPDRTNCLGCGRCFAYCPRERVRHAGPQGGQLS